MRLLLLASFFALTACMHTAGADDLASEPEPSAMPESAWLTHAVFFELKHDDDDAIAALVDACYKYLAPHDGIVHFSAGARHMAYQREVNDLDFDVALTIVFESTAAQDAYQVTEPHLQFIDEFNDNWASVRVFDSLAPVGR